MVHTMQRNAEFVLQSRGASTSQKISSRRLLGGCEYADCRDCLSRGEMWCPQNQRLKRNASNSFELNWHIARLQLDQSCGESDLENSKVSGTVEGQAPDSRFANMSM